jgi:amino acid transporter
VVLLIQAVLATASTRIVAMINSAGVGVELVIVAVLVIVLGVAAAITGDGSVADLTSRGVAENSPDYFPIGGGLMLAVLMGMTTLVGFDSAANLAEEARIRIAASRARSSDRSWRAGCSARCS